MSKAWQAGLPDSFTTVLTRTDSDHEPLALAYHDGVYWRVAADSTPLFDVVHGWMHLELAAEILDAAKGGAS